VAGAGTTFAALPDLIGMLRRRSSKGMNPTMAGIMCVFQIGWIYYGLLIASRPVIVWNMIAVVINSLSVAAYFRFARSNRSDDEGLFTTSSPILASRQLATRSNSRAMLLAPGLPEGVRF
jgi:MtN3 and saliva related transmembrane protein